MLPKNILMIGPTGCGKTEISRRLARLAGAPFLKVEATKFTEVGYVGRDVDSIVRDLVEVGIGLMREAKRKEVKALAEKNAEERVLDALVGASAVAGDARELPQAAARQRAQRQGDRDPGRRDAAPQFPTFDIPGGQVGMINLNDMLGKAFGQRTKPRSMTVGQAYDILIAQESDKLLDQDQIVQDAMRSVENDGIVFLDEIDKICARSETGRIGADVSREGVQRDLLPLIEGTTVSTKYGPVKTDHVLFIASGAFHMAKPSDLLPELQGRLPIRVELKPLTTEDFRRILTEPEASLIKQYVALMADRGRDAEVHRRFHRRAGRHRRAGELHGREHRRAAPADGDGAGARRDLLRRHRQGRRDHHHRCGLRAGPHRRPRQERRSEQVHLVMRLSGRGAQAPRPFGVAVAASVDSWRQGLAVAFSLA